MKQVRRVKRRDAGRVLPSFLSGRGGAPLDWPGMAVRVSGVGVVAAIFYAIELPVPCLVLWIFLCLILRPALIVAFAAMAVGLVSYWMAGMYPWPHSVSLPQMLFLAWLAGTVPFILTGRTPFVIDLIRAPAALQKAAAVLWGWLVIAGLLCGIALCFDFIPLLVSLNATGVFVLAAGETGRVGGKSILRLRWHLMAVNMLLLLSSAAVALLLAELLMAGASSFRPLYRSDPEFVFQPQPGGQSTRWVPVTREEKKRITLKLSEQGLRDTIVGPKEEDEIRIVVLGDSFVIGHAVAPEQTFSAYLQAQLARELPDAQVRVINGGLSGAGPVQQRGMLEHILLPLEPDLVLYGAYPENDLGNVLESLQRRPLRAYHQDWLTFLARFIDLEERRVSRIDLWLARHSSLFRRARLVGLIPDFPLTALADRCRFHHWEPAFAMPARENRRFYYETDLAEWYPELEEAMSLFQVEAQEIARLCSGAGVDLGVFVIPHHYVLRPEEMSANDEKYPALYNYGHGIRRVEQFFAVEENLPVISLYDALRGRPDIDKLYYLLDGHYTPLGNQMVSEKLARYVIEEWYPTHLVDKASAIREAGPAR